MHTSPCVHGHGPGTWACRYGRQTSAKHALQQEWSVPYQKLEWFTTCFFNAPKPPKSIQIEWNQQQIMKSDSWESIRGYLGRLWCLKTPRWENHVLGTFRGPPLLESIRRFAWKHTELQFVVLYLFRRCVSSSRFQVTLIHKGLTPDPKMLLNHSKYQSNGKSLHCEYGRNNDSPGLFCGGFCTSFESLVSSQTHLWSPLQCITN
jgi:hypothetical protein